MTKFLTWPLLIALFSWAEPSLAEDSAPEKVLGLVLYNQLKINAATQQLQIESNDGNSDSQYYLAEIIRKKSRYMAPEAQHWYEKAAEKDNIYAMIQLGRHKMTFVRRLVTALHSRKPKQNGLHKLKD